jgi:Na+/melibiose symporter-like transporter
MKLNYKKTFLLGFGFFAISLTWSLYNSFVPIFLRKFIESNFVVGFLMTLDNYAGLFLQPIFGTLSDKTRTKFGRRMPYLLFGMPVAVVLVSLIPLHWSLVSLVIAIVSLNLVMASFRSQL